MLAIYIVTLLVLMGSDILTSKVYAGSIGSHDSVDSSSKSGDSKHNDEQQCQEAIQKIIKFLNNVNQPLPACTCGSSGTISKIDIFNDKSRKTTTLVTCADCTGLQVPVTSPEECEYVPDIFHPDLKEFCQIVHLRCTSVTVYRCGCPAVSTTEARPTTLLTTRSFTEAGAVTTSTPLKTTTGAPLPPVTTQAPPAVVTNSPTPFLVGENYSY